VSEFLKVEFLDREKLFTLEIDPDFWGILVEFSEHHHVSIEVVLSKMLHSFGHFMLSELERGREGELSPQQATKLLIDIAECINAIAQGGVTITCMDCGATGKSLDYDDTKLSICGSCIAKRREGKTLQDFEDELRRLQENRLKGRNR
jgi:hypothetical protein